MKTVLPRSLSPTPADVSNADYDASERMAPWQKTSFLEMIIGGASQHHAVHKLDIPRLLVVREASLDPQFAEDLQLAIAARVDAIEEIAVEFATRGTIEDVYHQGIPVGEKVNYGAHALLQFLLKGNKPERYKDRVEQQVNVTAGPPPAVRNDRDAQKLLAQLQNDLRATVIEGQFEVIPPTDDVGDLL